MSDPQLNPGPSPSLKERILLNQKIANCLGESIESVQNLSAADKAYYIDAFNLELTKEEKDELARKVPCYTARVKEEVRKPGKRKRIPCFDRDDDFIVDEKQSSFDADLMNLYSSVPSGSGRVRRKAAINASKKMTLNEGEINEALINSESESSASANPGKDECIDVDNDNLTPKPNVPASNVTEELNEKYADSLSHINSYFKKPVMLNHIRPVEKIFAEVDFPLLDPSKIVAPDTCPNLDEFPSLSQHMNTIRDLSSHGVVHSSLSDVEWFNLCDTRRKFFKFREPTAKDNVDAVSDKLEFRETTAKDDVDTIIDKFEFPSLTESKTDHYDTQHSRSDDYQDDFFADSNINRNESKPRLKLPKKKSGDLKIDVFFDKKSSKTEPNRKIALVPKEGTLLHQNIQRIISNSSLSVSSTDNSGTDPVDNVGDEVNRDIDNEAVEAKTGHLDDVEKHAANCDKE